jgi:hypothetical protein
MGSSKTIEIKCVRELSGERGLTCVNTNVPPTYLLGGVPWGYESGDLSSSGFATETNCWSRRRTDDHCRNLRAGRTSQEERHEHHPSSRIA